VLEGTADRYEEEGKEGRNIKRRRENGKKMMERKDR
jgi:hypothetical protein